MLSSKGARSAWNFDLRTFGPGAVLFDLSLTVARMGVLLDKGYSGLGGNSSVLGLISHHFDSVLPTMWFPEAPTFALPRLSQQHLARYGLRFDSFGSILAAARLG